MPQPKKSKKTTTRGARRLSADAEFTVLSLTRRDIADRLNAAALASRSRVKHFDRNDARLSDKLCEAFAWSVFDQLEDNPGETLEEAQRDVAADTLEEFEDVVDR